MDEDTIKALIAKYCDAAQRTGSPEGGENFDPKQHNKFVKTLLACYDKLHNEESGKSHIMALMSHPNPRVRLWAASHSLQWATDVARKVLEDLGRNGGPGSFDAEMTLSEFDKGRLRF